jgi:hypothetical protein
MLHAHVQRFDVTVTAQKILGLFGHLNAASLVLKWNLENHGLMPLSLSIQKKIEGTS